MKKVLILGSNGMAGHITNMALREKFDITTCARSNSDINVDLSKFEDLNKLKGELKKFDVVINCVGLLIKQSEDNKKDAIFINSFLPHFISENCNRLIHLSTDCVFNGRNGPYNENSYKDGENFYSKTKSAGEIDNKKDLTFRLSIIGPELKNGVGLFNWIFNQTNINGYTNHLWNGITTLELTKALYVAIKDDLSGIYHLSNDDGISKCNLIKKIVNIFNLNICVKDFQDINDINKVLINNRIDFNYKVSNYDTQIKELKDWIVEYNSIYKMEGL